MASRIERKRCWNGFSQNYHVRVMLKKWVPVTNCRHIFLEFCRRYDQGSVIHRRILLQKVEISTINIRRPPCSCMAGLTQESGMQRQSTHFLLHFSHYKNFITTGHPHTSWLWYRVQHNDSVNNFVPGMILFGIFGLKFVYFESIMYHV